MTVADELVEAFSQPRPAPEAWTRFEALVDGDAEVLAEVVRLFVARGVSGGVALDQALAFLPLDVLGDLVAPAVDEVVTGRTGPGAEVLARIGLQAPELLAPHLSALWLTRGSERHEWAAAAPDERARLVAELDGPHARDAVLALLATRDVEALRHVVASAWAAAQGSRLALFLQEGGFDSELRDRLPRAGFHLLLPPELLAPLENGPAHLRPRHPSFRGTPVAHAAFGGRSDVACGSCHEPLQRLLRLDPVPAGLGVSLPVLDVVTCLACLGWEVELLCLRHTPDGGVTPLLQLAEPAEPDFPAEEHAPVLEGTVGLGVMDPRWRRQDWAMANSRENLHRLGGPPTWVQGAQHPDCPSCGRVMTFLLQLDSLPCEGDDEFLWGSGGLAYVCWCDTCSISGAFWQCT